MQDDVRVVLSAVGWRAPARALAQAQSYPSRPVRIIVGFAAGGPSDIVARIVAQQLTERLGRPVVVENRPGATGMIGAEVVAKSPPDGHALYLASQTTHAVAPYMYAKAPYDPIRDFATVSLVAHNPLLCTDASLARREVDQGADRAREGAPGRSQLRDRRAGLVAAHVGRAAEEHDRHQDGGDPLQGRRRGDLRPAGRAGADHVREHRGPAAAREERESCGASRSPARSARRSRPSFPPSRNRA